MLLLEATTQPWAEAAIKLVKVETVVEAGTEGKSLESTSDEEIVL